MDQKNPVRKHEDPAIMIEFTYVYQYLNSIRSRLEKIEKRIEQLEESNQEP